MGIYRIAQIKMPLAHKLSDIPEVVARQYGFNQTTPMKIVKKSIDARRKDDIKIVYTVDVTSPRLSSKKLEKALYFETEENYVLPGKVHSLNERPVIVGAGPAGLFAALILAENGAKPIVIERGQAVEQRIKDVEAYFATGILNTSSNIQFGEGGAGTFSDGKINTGVKDKLHRIDKIVEAFIEAGAPEEIRYTNKPHIGTDYLIEVVKHMREKIIGLGGEFHFGTTMTSLLIENNAIQGVTLDHGTSLKSHHVVLAIGHSARDTFEQLVVQEVPLEKKAFAIGLRIEHPQALISKKQYGDAFTHKNLPAADYKLTYRTAKGRAVYTFCMCPGGFVVNSASEIGRVVCNGMSNFARDEVNANSAILVNVHPEDFEDEDVLAGVSFQRQWETKAFEIAGSDYSLPIQRFDDFVKGQVSTSFGLTRPNMKGKYTFANLNETLPEFVAEAIKEGVVDFGKKIKGFDRGDAILTGVETRTSSPIRIIRDDETYRSPIIGLYPCGEGAGYAGGIMSAALDGIKVAESILTQ